LKKAQPSPRDLDDRVLQQQVVQPVVLGGWSDVGAVRRPLRLRERLGRAACRSGRPCTRRCRYQVKTALQVDPVEDHRRSVALVPLMLSSEKRGVAAAHLEVVEPQAGVRDGPARHAGRLLQQSTCSTCIIVRALPRSEAAGRPGGGHAAQQGDFERPTRRRRWSPGVVAVGLPRCRGRRCGRRSSRGHFIDQPTE